MNAKSYASNLSLDEGRIDNFMPSWFAVNMGTGVVSSLLWSFPYGPQSIMRALATVLLVLNIGLFVVFCGLSTARYFQYPKSIQLILGRPVHSLYLACLPMGFATIINATLDINQGYGLGGEPLLYTLWALWWLDSIISLAAYFLILYPMITRQNHSIKGLPAVWLLPATAPIVSSTSGALLARAMLPHSNSHTILTLLVSTILLFLGLSLTFMILPLYALGLITKRLPETKPTAFKLLPVGPCGQGGAAFVIIGQVFAEIARRGLSDHILLGESQTWTVLGLSCGFFLWGFGLWWILASISDMREALRWDPPNFTMGFWGMVFPLGAYAFLTLQLSQVLGSTLLQRLAATLSVAVFLLWGMLAAAAIHQDLLNGKQLSSAPRGVDLPRNLSPMTQANRGFLTG
ncbi:Plasma membrane sulfite pump involved in sulfite metabolism [Ceratobasidium sp. 394]|nr:Plasma membrane sulfite pump involved in sulfite metabolism [Ceratobasidium sp. 394]